MPSDQVLEQVERVRQTLKNMNESVREAAVQAGFLDPRYMDFGAQESLIAFHPKH